MRSLWGSARLLRCKLSPVGPRWCFAPRAAWLCSRCWLFPSSPARRAHRHHRGLCGHRPGGVVSVEGGVVHDDADLLRRVDEYTLPDCGRAHRLHMAAAGAVAAFCVARRPPAPGSACGSGSPTIRGCRSPWWTRTRDRPGAGVIGMDPPPAAGTAESYEVAVERGPVGCDDPAVGQQLAGVLEHDDAVAQQAPALLRVGGHDVSGLAVRRAYWRAGRLMRTVHDASPGPRPRWNSLTSLILPPAPGKARKRDPCAVVANPDAPHTRRDHRAPPALLSTPGVKWAGRAPRRRRPPGEFA